MSASAPVTIHRVGQLDLWVGDYAWPFATARRSDIDAHFEQRRAEQPKLWNGRVLMARRPQFDGPYFSAEFFETDFASFLCWREWEFPDASVFNGFGMGVIRASDGAILLGEMGAHTSNAGRVYFAGGTPDPSDVRNRRLEMASSVAREVKEETGLTRFDYQAADHWHCVEAGAFVAMLRILDVDQPGDALKARVEKHLAQEEQPEFSRMHLVRSKDDFLPSMPRFVTAFLTMLLRGED